MRRVPPRTRKPVHRITVTVKRRRNYHAVDVEEIQPEVENPDWLVGAY